jgi:hypothetical protein
LADLVTNVTSTAFYVSFLCAFCVLRVYAKAHSKHTKTTDSFCARLSITHPRLVRLGHHAAVLGVPIGLLEV